MSATAEFDLRTVPIADVFESPFNTRTHFDADKLRELEASIREAGIITPMIVRPVGDRYELAAGHRRLRAAKSAGIERVPVSVRTLTDLQLREIITIENLQREDIHPLDEARGYQALLKAAKKAYTVAHVAAKVGKSESYVYRRLKLLELEETLQTALGEDRLSLAHAEKLMRLPPALRQEAADPERGVVWFISPLFQRRDPSGQEDDSWTPQAEDLRPLHDLEQFIRTRHHFDPASRDVRHLQPDFADQLDEVTKAIAQDSEDFDDNVDVAVDAAVASLVELTLDPMARMKLRAGPNDTIPLTPSKWREVKSEKDRCSHQVRGVVTHGGAARVIEVCVKRSCPKHFPVAKKKPAGKKATAAPARDTWKEEEAKRHAERKDWEALLPLAGRAFAAFIAKVKLNAALVRTLLSSLDLKQVENRYGVTLTDATAVQVLALNGVTTWSPSQFGADTKPYGWDFKAFEKKYRADVDAKGKAALKASREQLKKKGTAKTAAKKKGGK